jgi:hypothetical protein
MTGRLLTLVLATLVAASAAGCGAVAGLLAGVPDRPRNEQALPPFVLIAQGTGAGGDYRAWVYATSDGWTCVETAAKHNGGRSCVPVGQAWDGGPGMSAGDDGVFVDGSTTLAIATSAVVHDGAGGSVTVPLADAAPVLPGVRFFVAGFAPGSAPTTADIVDASGTVLETISFP